MLKITLDTNSVRVEQVSAGPSMIVQDGNKQARALLGYIGPEHLARGVADVRAPSSLVLLDKDGRIVWKAP